MSARNGVRQPAQVGKELRPNERAVLAAAARGLSVRETASELYLSHWTVANHRATMMDKLGALSLPHAVHLAHLQGIL